MEKTNNIFKGVFKESSREARKFLASIDLDKEMILEDILCNEAHLIMLYKRGLIDRAATKEMLNCLEVLKEKVRAGKFQLNPELEDVHLNIEAYIIEKAGVEHGGKLHLARSRNDQVLTDVKLHLRNELLELSSNLLSFVKTLLRRAEKETNTVMPGFTHLQHAQPITLGFWLTCYVSMFLRDLERLSYAYERVNTSPLGACALAGTSLEIDRDLTKKLLGFDKLHEHALDAVSSRDFILETLSALAILMSNLSRLSEELVLWNSKEFSFVKLPDKFISGSSIMPQKRNPDVLELIRGKASYVLSAFVQVLSLVKSLPLGYNRDFQEDRRMLWESLRISKSSVSLLKDLFEEIEFDRDRMFSLLCSDFLAATELANALVRKYKKSFRESHYIVSELVKELMKKNKTLMDISEVKEFLEKHNLPFSKSELEKVLDPRFVVKEIKSKGGTSPKEVKRMIGMFKKEIEKHEKTLEKRKKRLEDAYNLLEAEILEILTK